MLQLIGTIASLYLPTLNADIIDNGVAKGDTGYIMRTGAWMLASASSRSSLDRRRLLRRRAPRWRWAATCAPAIFHRVGDFSAREVAQFGAPSLITRNTNDVQQVQMVVLMTGDAGVRADHAWSAASSWRCARTWRCPGWCCRVPVLAVAVGLVIRRMMPLFRLMQTRSTASTGCCASRSPASAWSGPSSASRTRRTGSARPTPT